MFQVKMTNSLSSTKEMKLDEQSNMLVVPVMPHLSTSIRIDCELISIQKANVCSVTFR